MKKGDAVTNVGPIQNFQIKPLPEQKTLIAGDNYYSAFPNLYTIRGTSFRNLKNWYQSVDKMRDLNPQYLVPCHTRPIIGRTLKAASRAFERLTALIL